MKRINIFIYVLFSVVIVFIIGCYMFFLLGLPKALATESKINQYEKFLSQKMGIPISIKKLSIKTKPNFDIIIKIPVIESLSVKNEKLVLIEDLKYSANIFNLKHGQLDSEDLYIDLNTIKKYLNLTDNQNKKPFNIPYFPSVHLHNGYVKLDETSYIDIDYIKSAKTFGKIKTELLAKISSPYTKSPVIVGDKGKIIYSNRLIFENFSMQFADANLFLSGDKSNLKLVGKSLPIKQIEQAFLYSYHLKHPDKKNFIENFHNLDGLLDVDLLSKNNKLSGTCTAYNLNALFSNFKFPVNFPETVFYFEGKTIKAKTSGKFGGEPVYTDISVDELFTPDLNISGNVSSKLTENFTNRHFKPIQIKGVADAKVKYNNKSGKVDVRYSLTIPKGSNLTSIYGNLDNIDKIRHITMHTTKQGDPIKVEDYDYSFIYDKAYQKLLSGDGLFEKINGRYSPKFFTLKTNGDISVNIIKSFLRDYISNGTFDADLRYEFLSKDISGVMNLYNISHSDFLFLKNTNIKIENNKLKFKSEGTFYDSALTANAVADSNFRKDILVHDVDIHLDKYFVQRGKLKSIPSTFKKGQTIKPRKRHNLLSDVTVEQGRIRVDKIYSRKFDVHNVNIQGSLKNEIAHFIIPKAEYAKGLLSAKGIYNLSNHSSDIEFFASDIDSDEVATNFFKLKNQVEGDAFATLHVITKNKLNDIKAKATFAISDGFLPSIGSREFIINSSKHKAKSKLLNNKIVQKLNIKLTLSKIINIDFSKPNIFYSNLYGTFNIDNEQVDNVRIFSKSDFLSLFIEGDYNIDEEYGNLNLWGRRNKTEAKKIRIFKIPFNLIYKIVFRPEHSKDMDGDKIALIPAIKTSVADDISLFRIFVSGYLNSSDKLKVEMKDLR